MNSKSFPTILSGVLVILIGAAIVYRWNSKRVNIGSSPGATGTSDSAATQQIIAPSPSALGQKSTITQRNADTPNAADVRGAGQGTQLGTGQTVSPIDQSEFVPDLSVDSRGLSKTTAVMTLESGVVRFKFYSQDAPNTVTRIIELMKKGFYNGLIFHRVVPDFVVQGGDPTGTGTGGSGQKLKAEFNKRKHVEGTIAMARARDPDSADSQFYVCLTTTPHLDNDYTVFGQVVEGMDLIKKIKKSDKMLSVRLE